MLILGLGIIIERLFLTRFFFTFPKCYSVPKVNFANVLTIDFFQLIFFGADLSATDLFKHCNLM